MILLITLLYSVNFVLSQENYFVEVSLSQGILRGLRIRTAFNRDAFAFMGIPYATPPYNQLRFKV